MAEKHTLVNPGDDYVTQFGWETVGSIIDIHAALAAGEMDDDTVQALDDDVKAIYYPTNGTVAAEFRFWADGATADETATIEVYAAASEDYWRHVVQLTVTFGTAQRGVATKLFADTISGTSVWLSTATLVSPTADQIASWGLNVHGYHGFLFLVSAATMDLDPAVAGVADDTLWIEARRF